MTAFDYGKHLEYLFAKQKEYLGTDKEVNMTEPLVSVCVAAYQHGAFIAQCLDSILSQESTFPFEIIIGEDGSSDNTREICQAYADRHPDKIRLFLRNREETTRKRDGRMLYFNFKLVLMSCRGKYMAWCEGDDYWCDNSKLQKQCDFLEQHPDYGLVYSRFGVVNHAGEITGESRPIYNSGRECFDMWKSPVVGTPTVMNRVDLMKGLLERVVHESLFFTMDIWFWRHLAILSKVHGFDEKMSVYRVHAGGITKNPNSKLHYNVALIEIDTCAALLASDRMDEATWKERRQIANNFMVAWFFVWRKGLDSRTRKVALRLWLSHPFLSVGMVGLVMSTLKSLKHKING